MKWRSQSNVLLKKRDSAFSRIIVLTGARQTGKTTLAKHCFNDYQYISIEDPVQRGNYLKLTAAQWQLFYPKAILDEVQKEPVLIESIKAVYDQFPDTYYVLLGSSQLLLLNKVKETLAGRCTIEEIYPLTLPELQSDIPDRELKFSVFQKYLTTSSLPEMLPNFQLYSDFAERQQVFDYYLMFGGYPALSNINITNAERNEWLRNYVRTYLERDIRDLAEFKYLEPFVKIQRISALLTGQLINFSSIANEADISAKTAQKFLHYLEISYQTIMLQPWHKNPLKRLNKSPKLHYLDPGVQRAVIQKQGDLSGNEFESAVVSEIFKQTKSINSNPFFYHLRTFDGREVDLLLETEQGYLAFEIKMTSKVNDSDCKHLRQLNQILDKPVIQSFVLSLDVRIQRFTDNILAIPAALFLT